MLKLLNDDGGRRKRTELDGKLSYDIVLPYGRVGWWRGVDNLAIELRSSPPIGSVTARSGSNGVLDLHT